MEEEVGLVDEAHAARVFAHGEDLAANVEGAQLQVLACAAGVCLALVDGHDLVRGRPHAQVVQHLGPGVKGSMMRTMELNKY